MFDWAVRPKDRMETVLRVGLITTLAGAVVKGALERISPTPILNVFISMVLAILLSLPYLTRKRDSPKAPEIVHISLVVAIAYWVMALLYALTVAVPGRVGRYDALTDFVGTFLFFVAWFKVTESDHAIGWRTNERITGGMLILTGGLAAGLKFVADGDPPASEAAFLGRTILNLVSGAVFLGLFRSMARQYAAPDPISHIVIIVFGLAQIVASSRDCLSLATACRLPDSSAIVALAIEWGLLLGKPFFAGYLLYLVSRAHANEEPPPRMPVAAEKGSPTGT